MTPGPGARLQYGLGERAVCMIQDGDSVATLMRMASDEMRDAFEVTRQADTDLAMRRSEWMILDEEARGVLKSANPGALCC